MEAKLDKIIEALGNLNTDIKLVQQEIGVLNNRGCMSSVKAIIAVNERIDKNEKEHTFIKGVAYAGGIIGSITGYLLSYFNSK